MSKPLITRPARWRVVCACIGGLAVATASCTLGSPRMPAESMSSMEHRSEAREHEKNASVHNARFDPTAKASSPLPFGFAVVPHINAGSSDIGQPEWGYATQEYNPTARHLDHAAEHHEHAAEHYAAAQALEDFTHDRCRTIDPDVRARCPLHGSVDAVEDLRGGVRLRLAPGVSMNTTLDQMRCHYAFATQLHFEGHSHCPLYLPQIQIAPGADGKSIILRSDKPSVVSAVRSRAKASVEAMGQTTVPTTAASPGR